MAGLTGTQVIFGLGGQLYGMDSRYVRAVETELDVKILPGAPECITGMAELRGELIPICDLFTKFNLRGKPSDREQYIFADTVAGCIGCRVDEVREIGAVTEDLCLELPGIVRSDATSYVSGIVRHKGELVTTINPDNLLSPEERELLSKALKCIKDAEEKEE